MTAACDCRANGRGEVDDDPGKAAARLVEEQVKTRDRREDSAAGRTSRRAFQDELASLVIGSNQQFSGHGVTPSLPAAGPESRIIGCLARTRAGDHAAGWLQSR